MTRLITSQSLSSQPPREIPQRLSGCGFASRESEARESQSCRKERVRDRSRLCHFGDVLHGPLDRFPTPVVVMDHLAAEITDLESEADAIRISFLLSYRDSNKTPARRTATMITNVSSVRVGPYLSSDFCFVFV